MRETKLNPHVIPWFFVLMTVLTVFGLLRHFREVNSLQWLATPGIIDQSEAGPPKGRGGCEHILLYTYSVSGRAYAGTRKTLHDRHYSRDTIDAVVAKYPIGMRVEVHYDPARPEESVLTPGPGEEQRLLYQIGIAMLVFNPALAIFFFGRARRHAA